MLFRSTLFEAADQPGGQLRLAARVPRRRELIGIVDWRLARCTEAGVALRFNSFVGAEAVLSEDPEVVIVATGGLPNHDLFPGAALAASSWDILSGDVAVGGSVLLYADNAPHPRPAGPQ